MYQNRLLLGEHRVVGSILVGGARERTEADTLGNAKPSFLSPPRTLIALFSSLYQISCPTSAYTMKQYVL